MDAYGNEIDSEWTAMLMTNNPADGAARNVNIDSGGTFNGTTTGGGQWSGQFHDARTDADTNAIAPGAAAGVFDAHFDNGHVAGAFGANIVEDEN